jgi:MFS family permease
MLTTAKGPCDEASIEAGGRESVASESPATGRWVLAATILGSSIAFIDGTVVNVALPTIQEELGATQAGIQWVVLAYALFLAALILVGGSLGDHLGRRRVYAIASRSSRSPRSAAASPRRSRRSSPPALSRGSAGRSSCRAAWRSSARRSPTGSAAARAIGTWSAFTAITSAIGPVLGGWLVDNASWRWIFFINVPLAAVVLASR